MRRAAVGTAVGVAVLVLASLAWSEPLNPRIKVQFTNPVVVNSQTLSPGTYVFQQVRGRSNLPVFRVSDNQGTNLTLTAVAIQARAPQSASNYSPPAASDTEVVLQKIGGQYYLDKIWIQGRSRGWDFEIPASVKSQASSMQQEIVNGSYEQDQEASGNQSQSSADNSQSANSNSSQMNSTTTSETASTSSNNSSTSPQQSTSNMTPQQQTYSAVGPTQYTEQAGTAAQTGESNENATAATMSNNSAQSAATSGSMSAADQTNSVSGCLRKDQSTDAYYVQTSGDRVSVQASPDLSNEMQKQVGHMVRLVGSRGETGSSMSGTGSTSGSSLSTGGQFRVDRIDVISMSCSQ